MEITTVATLAIFAAAAIDYAILAAMRANLDASWGHGAAILGINFGVWAFPLYLLL